MPKIIKIEVDGIEFTVDQEVLSTLSKMLKCMFIHDNKESNPDKFKLATISADSFKFLLRLIDGDFRIEDCHDISRFLEDAHFLQIPMAIRMGELALIADNGQVPVRTKLQYAEVFGLTELQKHLLWKVHKGNVENYMKRTDESLTVTHKLLKEIHTDPHFHFSHRPVIAYHLRQTLWEHQRTYLQQIVGEMHDEVVEMDQAREDAFYTGQLEEVRPLYPAAIERRHGLVDERINVVNERGGTIFWNNELCNSLEVLADNASVIMVRGRQASDYFAVSPRATMVRFGSGRIFRILPLAEIQVGFVPKSWLNDMFPPRNL